MQFKEVLRYTVKLFFSSAAVNNSSTKISALREQSKSLSFRINLDSIMSENPLLTSRLYSKSSTPLPEQNNSQCAYVGCNKLELSF